MRCEHEQDVPLPPQLHALVTVVEDRPIVALGLQRALSAVPEAAGVLLVGRTPRRSQVVRDGVEAGRPVVVVLDDGERSGAVTAALDTGALGVVLTSATVRELADVVRRAAGGEVAVGALAARRVAEARELRAHFSAREVEALGWYARGLPAKSVARRMQVGLETVKTYLKRLRDKAAKAGLPAQTRVELADLARRLDLL